MTKSEYEQLNESEKARAHSENKINAYICPNGHFTFTVDRDYGVTPFMIRCEHRQGLASHSSKGLQVQCKELAQSRMYGIYYQYCKPTHEFYRPSFEYFQSLKSEALKEHIKHGGLAFRKIGDLECYQ